MVGERKGRYDVLCGASARVWQRSGRLGSGQARWPVSVPVRRAQRQRAEENLGPSILHSRFFDFVPAWVTGCARSPESFAFKKGPQRSKESSIQESA